MRKVANTLKTFKFVFDVTAHDVVIPLWIRITRLDYFIFIFTTNWSTKVIYNIGIMFFVQNVNSVN